MFVLQLFSNNTNEWLEFNEQGVLVSRLQYSDLSSLPKINPSDFLTILCPGEQLLLTKVKLPKMGLSEKLKAVPYALEEQLIGDPDQVLVALGSVKSTGEETVAVLEKNLFVSTINAWREHELFPQVVLPDFLAIRWEPETWSIVIKNNTACVRTGFDDGFSVDVDNLILYLQRALEESKDSLPKRILCWQNEMIISPAELEKLNFSVEMIDDTKQSPFDLAALFSHPPINLLQGKYKPKLPFSASKKNWWWCGVAAGVLIFLLFAAQFTQWIYFSYQSKKLEDRIHIVYRQLFPGAESVLEPHFRTENLLKKYEAASEGGVFLKLLGKAGKVVLQFPALSLQSILYENHKLHLTVQANKIETINACFQALQTQGFSADNHIVNTAPNSVTAEIVLQENTK